MRESKTSQPCLQTFIQTQRSTNESAPIALFFPTLNTLLAEVSYLALCIFPVFSWLPYLFPKTAMKVLRKIQPVKRCRRTLLAGYSIIGFAVTSVFPTSNIMSSQRSIFNWLTEQTIKLLSISVSFLSVFIFPSYRSSYMQSSTTYFLNSNNFSFVSFCNGTKIIDLIFN